MIYPSINAAPVSKVQHTVISKNEALGSPGKEKASWHLTNALTKPNGEAGVNWHIYTRGDKSGCCGFPRILTLMLVHHT